MRCANYDLRRVSEPVYAQLFHRLVHITREKPTGAPIFRKMCWKSVFYALLLRHSREKSPRASPSVGMKVAEEKRGLVCAQYRVRQRASAGRDYTLSSSHLSHNQ